MPLPWETGVRILFTTPTLTPSTSEYAIVTRCQKRADADPIIHIAVCLCFSW